MKVDKCKGMRDLFPADMEKFHLINEAFRASCLNWGYEEVKTPIVEYLHLFTSAGTLTPGMLNKVYSFLDWDGWSGERVVLRPDTTIPVARLYNESLSDKELAKLFYIANTFIFEANSKKNREKWQCGAELIGIGSPLADVELIVLAMEVLKKLGLENVELRLSHAGLTRGILQKLGLSSEEQHQAFDRLLDGDTAVLEQIKTDKPELAQILALQGKSSGFVKNLTSTLALDLPDLKPQIDDFVFIADTLKDLGYKYQIDIASIQGFEYYTGVLFQLFVNDEKIGSGGRYDDLIPAMGGQNTHASGFALYVDLLMKLIQPNLLNRTAKPRIMIKINPDTLQTGFEISSLLRDKGMIVKLDLGGKGPADVAWKLEVRPQNPQFVLTSVSENQKYEFRTSEEVLGKLGR
jgi:histidyl-tRNA synthetase